MRSRLASAALAVGLLGGAAVPATVLVAPAASAHSVLLSSEPADGATLEASPEEVSFTFNEEINQSFATIAVTTADDRTNRTTEEPGAAGPRQADATRAAPAEAAEEDDERTLAPAFWVVGGLAVLLVVGGFFLLRRGD